MLPFGQLQEGLSFTLMESPSISSVQEYNLSAKKQERRLAELQKRQQYFKSGKFPSDGSCKRSTSKSFDNSQQLASNWNKSRFKQQSLRCYICNSPNHLAHDCRVHKTESQGRKTSTQKDNKIRSFEDGGRASRCVEVQIEGVQVIGLIDTGSDIIVVIYSIMLFRQLGQNSVK